MPADSPQGQPVRLVDLLGPGKGLNMREIVRPGFPPHGRCRHPRNSALRHGRGFRHGHGPTTATGF